MSRLLTLRPDLDVRGQRPTTLQPGDRPSGSVAGLTSVQPGASAAALGRRFEGDWPATTSAISEAELFMGYRNAGRRAR